MSYEVYREDKAKLEDYIQVFYFIIKKIVFLNNKIERI